MLRMTFWAAVMGTVAVFGFGVVTAVRAEVPDSATKNTLNMGPLSANALKAVVSGVALYPDTTVEQVLAAAQDTAGIHTAAGLDDAKFQQQQGNFNDSIRWLRANEPQLLQQLNLHLFVTNVLGRAAQSQLNDVWLAVNAVRAEYAALQQQQGANNYSANETVQYNNYVRYGSGLYSAAVLREVGLAYNPYHLNARITPNGHPVATVDAAAFRRPGDNFQNSLPPNNFSPAANVGNARNFKAPAATSRYLNPQIAPGPGAISPPARPAAGGRGRGR